MTAGTGWWRPTAGCSPTATPAFAGSMGAVRLTRPVVGMAVDAATGGYWLVASDGGVFAFDAPFAGSAGALGPALARGGDGSHRRRRRLLAGRRRRRGVRLRRRPLRRVDGGGAPHPTRGGHGASTPADRAGTGWWPPTAGCSPSARPYEGSTGALVLDRAVVAMAATPDGGGYWLVGADGGRLRARRRPLPGVGDGGPAGGADGGHRPRPRRWQRRRPGLHRPAHRRRRASPSPVTRRAPRPTTATPSTPSTSTSRCGPRPCSRPTGPASCSPAPPTPAWGPVSTCAPRSPTTCTPTRRCRSTPTAARRAGAGFAVDTPVPVVSSISDNRAIIGPSDAAVGVDMRNAFEAADRPEPPRTTRARTASSTAPTWAGSTCRRCPRSSSSAPTCATPTTPRSCRARRGARARPRASPTASSSSSRAAERT